MRSSTRCSARRRAGTSARTSPTRIATIRARLAGLLGVAVSRVSVKGKTNERMDDVGAGLGIAVHCVALLEETP